MEKDFRSKKDWAKKLALKELPVFPGVPNSKLPAIKDFPNRATTNLDTIENWWGNGHANANICISTNDLIVVDIDNKGDKKGDQELLRLEIDGFLFPPTLEQRTPTGGRHLIYRSPYPVRQGVNVLGNGLDIRAYGGYVVGAGSTLNNNDQKPYTINEHAVANAPEWLVGKLKAYSKKPEAKLKPDTSAAAEIILSADTRSKYYLEFEAPVAIEGQGGDHTAFTVAARLRDFGCSSTQAFALMSELWNPRCVPEWPSDELLIKVGNAYAYAENEIGSAAPELDFPDDLPVTVEPLTKKRKLLFQPLHEIEPKLIQEFLVDKLLSPGTMSVVYGESGAGKSFFILDMALHIATGQQWHERETKPGGVIYVAAEGGFGIKKRIEAFRQYHKIKERTDIPFWLVSDTLMLKQDNKEFIALVKQFTEEMGVKPALIVFDTLARLMEGNENDAKDMGAFIQTIDHIKTSTKAHTLLVHHTGKDTSKGARGHSALRAATDTEIFIENSQATVKKQRDMDSSAAIGFKLHQIVIAKTEKWGDITSCVVIPSNTLAIEDFSHEPLRPGSLAYKGHKALLNALEWAGVGAPDELELPEEKLVVSFEDFKKEMAEFYAELSTSNLNNTCKRALNTLANQGYINKNNSYVWLK